jgi:4-amino-4-deoxy-L-arabinose transferase-like glycosyltransferase
MLNSQHTERLLPYALLALFFSVSILVRPLLPVDETRYLSVAWEMYTRHSFLVPTLNFEPYFQKPPLLFWLIDLAWAAFGVSRISAILVVFAISSLVIVLTQRLAITLFPNAQGLQQRVPWLLLGSAAFVIYSSLILFDLLLTACVLGCFLALLSFANRGEVRYALLAGVCAGLGVLAKGPVLLIHITLPIAMYPLWRQPGSSISTRRFLAGVGLTMLVAGAIVLAWLGPALYSTGSDFAYGLVWEQSAGRVSGSARGAHVRPFYFYLLLLPVVVLPWGLSPGLWATRPWLRIGDRDDIGLGDLRMLQFLATWCVGELLVFSAISGKQPHYLLPVLPAMVLIFGYLMTKLRLSAIVGTATFMLGLFAIGQVIASAMVFYRYDLNPVAKFVAINQQAELAFAGRYQGELTFLARMEKPFATIEPSKINEWLHEHPSGYLVTKAMRYPDETRSVAYSQVVKNGYLVVLSEGQPTKISAR